MNIIERAIEASGGAAKLAQSLKLGRTAVVMWKANGRIPAEHIIAVERESGISRHELRPDIYPIEVVT